MAHRRCALSWNTCAMPLIHGTTYAWRSCHSCGLTLNLELPKSLVAFSTACWRSACAPTRSEARCSAARAPAKSAAMAEWCTHHAWHATSSLLMLKLSVSCSSARHLLMTRPARSLTRRCAFLRCFSAHPWCVTCWCTKERKVSIDESVRHLEPSIWDIPVGERPASSGSPASSRAWYDSSAVDPSSESRPSKSPCCATAPLVRSSRNPPETRVGRRSCQGRSTSGGAMSSSSSGVASPRTLHNLRVRSSSGGRRSLFAVQLIQTGVGMLMSPKNLGKCSHKLPSVVTVALRLSMRCLAQIAASRGFPDERSQRNMPAMLSMRRTPWSSSMSDMA
mmetsp:Transcript_7287/g.25681  ORF Transcript_7287/g.25681 Transcript_7287/m.25681 type:complete len:335 (-) Transcript_7287:2087-3091(-)